MKKVDNSAYYKQIAHIVETYGFTSEQDGDHLIDIKDTTHTVNFFADRKARWIVADHCIIVHLKFSAAPARCGGDYSAESLEWFGNKILSAAKLIKALNDVGVEYVEFEEVYA